MTVNRVLNQSQGALAANQKALATTSHNISNANTKGYSRQRVEMQSNQAINDGIVRVGTGVSAGAITRTSSTFVNKRLEEEASDLGHFETLNEIYTQLEADLGDETEAGITNRISRFFNDMRSLSTDPSSVPLRSAVRESANSVTTRFHNMRENIDAMVSDLDRRIESSVAEINSLTKAIADLNQRIVEIELVKGSFANDERDQRDLALRELAKHLPIQVTELENGGINVSSTRVGVLVDPSNNYELVAVRGEDEIHDAAVKIYTKEFGRLGRDVTAGVSGGSLGGLVKARDTVLPQVIERLDNLAYGFANALNSVHRQGYGTNGQTDVALFDVGTEGAKGAAHKIRLSEAITRDLSSLAAASVPSGKGDNRNLLAMADVEDATIFENGQANFQGYMASLVGNVGIEARSIRDAMETQGQVMTQLEQLREETAGVSLDEEALNMLKFQKAFDANAKMIQVADSMMETVLNLKRF
jgi:flagellar hook-associated protein 1 FlgK